MLTIEHESNGYYVLRDGKKVLGRFRELEEAEFWAEIEVRRRGYV